MIQTLKENLKAEIKQAVLTCGYITESDDLNVILENWQGKNDILIVLKNVVEYATNFTGAKNINSICKVLEELLSV